MIWFCFRLVWHLGMDPRSPKIEARIWGCFAKCCWAFEKIEISFISGIPWHYLKITSGFVFDFKMTLKNSFLCITFLKDTGRSFESWERMIAQTPKSRGKFSYCHPGQSGIWEARIIELRMNETLKNIRWNCGSSVSEKRLCVVKPSDPSVSTLSHHTIFKIRAGFQKGLGGDGGCKSSERGVWHRGAGCTFPSLTCRDKPQERRSSIYWAPAAALAQDRSRDN